MGPCARCGSSDGLATYSDGHTFCFAGCGDTQPGGRHIESAAGLIPLSEIDIRPIPDRKLWHDTCRLFGYGFHGQDQIATYYDKDRKAVGQKVRGPNKQFRVIGDVTKAALPFGAHLWPKTGRKIVVTEGEIDCMSMSQAQGNKYPVVSIATGAGPQIRSYMSRHREYFQGFEEVVLMFDSDSAGNAAAISACEVLARPYGSVKIAGLPLKDASMMLCEDRVDELLNAMWRAVPYRPTGFVDIGDIAKDILKGPVLGEPWPWPQLTRSTFGRRRGEIYTLGAGTGIGKTSAWLQVGADIIKSGSKVGFVLFENSHRDAGLRIAAAAAGKPFYVPDSSWTEEQLQSTLSTLTGKCLLYDTQNADWDSVASILRYWAGAEDCHHVVIDHLSAFSAQEEDDRKALDSVMAQLAKLTAELQLQVFLITHLKRPFGQSHEEGGRVRLDQFRGSNAIAMWSHFCLALERNQQADDKEQQHNSVLRVLKDRNTGMGTGDCIPLRWDKATVRLVERDTTEGF